MKKVIIGIIKDESQFETDFLFSRDDSTHYIFMQSISSELRYS